MMNKKIRSMIDEIFSDMKMSAENLALRDELMANAQARYEDQIANGMSEEDAFAEVAASLDDVRATLSETNANAKKAPEEDLGETIGKAFGALGDFGKQIVPHVERMVRQADEATGGVMSGIGKAVIKGTVDMGKAAGEAFDKLQKNMAESAAKKSQPITPDEMLRRAKDIRAQAEIKEAAGDQEGARVLRRKAYEMETRAQAEMEAEMIRKAQEAEQKTEEQENQESQDIENVLPDLEETDPEELAREAEEIVKDAEEAAAPKYETACDGTVVISHLPIENIRSIDVGMDADDVVIDYADTNEISVTWEGSGDNSEYPQAEVESGSDGDVLKIRRKNPDVFKTFFSVFKKQGGKIRISVPNGALLNYKIGTTSGDVTIFQVDAGCIEINSTSGKVSVQGNPSVPYRALRINSVSGNVDVRGSAQEVHASSVSGSVGISGKAEIMDCNAVSGKIVLSGEYDEIDVDNVSGTVSVNCERIPLGKVKIGTLSGAARLALPADIQGFSVESSCLSGAVINQFGVDRYGTCALPIRFDSVSGKLTILKNEG